MVLCVKIFSLLIPALRGLSQTKLPLVGTVGTWELVSQAGLRIVHYFAPIGALEILSEEAVKHTNKHVQLGGKCCSN